jgi:tocopherol cyclase
MTRIASLMHPEGYQGQGRQAPYFEGWYFKIVDAREEHVYAIIPGVSMSEGGEGPHAFVQVLNGNTGATAYYTYPLDDAEAAPDRLDVRIGPNHFTSRGMDLDLPEGELTLKGLITFDDLNPWPVTLAAPGIMGWYAWVPWMECYHGVPSLDHGLAGSLRTPEGEVDFDGGRGYIEKDWGASFPEGWVWMQSNHFQEPGVSLTGSIATIPWGVPHTPFQTAFRGFIVGLFLQGTLIRFTTYTGAITERLVLSDREVIWVMQDDLYRLTLRAHRAGAGHLRGPSKTDMGRPVLETLQGRIDVHLTTLAPERSVFQGTGRHAGLEVGGDSDVLVTSR